MSCDCGTANCGCCAGIEVVTPRTISNRPGVASLSVRIGNHGDFMASLQARLSSHRLTVDGLPEARPLAGLTTRDRDDASIALLDAFAVAGDVLTFYNERIANESYLRTATAFRSVQELARLVGYTPRPGVAAGTYLAFTVDPGTKTPLTIAKGTRVQSVPGPDEEPQSFETSLDLEARASWNALGLRKTEPQMLGVTGGRLYLAGTTTGLKPGDALLFEFTGNATPVPMRVVAVEVDGTRTAVTTEAWTAKPSAGGSAVGAGITALPSGAGATTAPAGAGAPLTTRLERLGAAASSPPSSAAQLVRAPAKSFASGAGATLQLLGVAAPAVRDSLASSIAGYEAAAPRQPARVFAMRLRAGLFGRSFAKISATLRTRLSDNIEQIGTTEVGEWPIVFARTGVGIATGRERSKTIRLDAAYDGIAPQSWVLVDMRAVPPVGAGTLVAPAAELVLAKAVAVEPKAARADYGGSGDSTELQLDKDWITYAKFPEVVIGDFVAAADQPFVDREFQIIRRTTVYARPEELALAEAPIDTPFCAPAGTIVELDALYAELEPGRYVIVSGERADIADTRGVFASEVAMLSSVVNDVRSAKGPGPRGGGSVSIHGDQDLGLAGDRTHSFVEFAAPLSYCYVRDTVVIHGNVVKATHGETRRELLGNGDAAKPNQAFALKHKPLTWTAAATARGAVSSLEVFVDDIRWSEVPHLIDAAATDRVYMLRTGADGTTAAVFGDGIEGARPPTGQSNIAAVYRAGIGRPGNVRARQIEQLVDRPLGVREVINPRPATGGADPESRDQARRNAPLETLALDRLVSVRDHADFARTFAGIAKADARLLSDGARQLVHLSVAAEADAPLDPTSDLLLALRQALARLGDPFSPVRVAPRELRLLIIAARIRLQPDRRWEVVAAEARARAFERFGFDARELGQGLAASAVIAALQAVPGVAYVDLDTFGSVATLTSRAAWRVPLTPDETTVAVAVVADTVAPWIGAQRARFEGGLLLPAELLMLSPDIPATLILNEIK